MHPRQRQVLGEARSLVTQLTRSKQAAGAAVPAQAVLWKYEDPDGNTFYLAEKRMTVRSPFTGKSFPAKPKRHTPAQVSKEIKEEAAQPSGAEKTARFVDPFADDEF